MTEGKANLTMNEGVSMDGFFLQIRIFSISLPLFKNLSLRFAVSEGSRILDTTKEDSSWADKCCQLKKSVLNFQAPERPSNKHSYLLKVLRAGDLEQIASIDIRIKTIVTQFLFQGYKKFERKDSLSNGCEIHYVVYIHKSRVLLFNEILKQGGASEEEINLPQIAKVRYISLDDSHQKQNNQKAVTNQEKFQALNKLIEENKNIVTKATGKYTKFAPPPLHFNKPLQSPRLAQQTTTSKPQQAQISPKQIESPLMKIVKGKLQTRSVHDNLRRAQSLKHVTSEKLLIKRTDSIDEDEEVHKKKNCKRFIIGFIIFLLAYFFLFIKKKPLMKPVPKQVKTRRSKNKRKV